MRSPAPEFRCAEEFDDESLPWNPPRVLLNVEDPPYKVVFWSPCNLRAVVCKNHRNLQHLESDPLRICSFSHILHILVPKTSFQKFLANLPKLGVLRVIDFFGHMAICDFRASVRLFIEQNNHFQWDFLG